VKSLILLYNMTMYDQKHPFNADDAVLQDGVPSDRWIQKNHPDALKVNLYDEMIHATQKDFVVSQIEIARNKGYSVRLQGLSNGLILIQFGTP